MTQNNSSKPSFARPSFFRLWKKTATFLGLGFTASSLAWFLPSVHSPSNAQNPSGERPYCFGVQANVDVYASPSFGAPRIAAYVSGDTAYATTNDPTSSWVNDGTADGNSFIEVAFTGGQTGWVPRFPAGSDVPILIDMEGVTDCPNPMPPAAGSEIKGVDEDRVCFYVDQPTNLYSRPEFGAVTSARYNVGDIAYASYPFESVPVENGTNAFILVDIYGGNQAWVPRYPRGSATPILIDYPAEECERP